LEETKKKISLAHKGKKKPWAGKFITEEGRRKISEKRRGEKNNNWKGGISPLYAKIRNLYEYRVWRCDIFKRDNYTCQFCRIKGGYLEVDHYPKMRSEIIKEYNIKSVEDALACSELWDVNNGRTLCRICHNKTKYGRPY
jgi:5-methylcytosine-specific restriction endonuclease McrA